MEEIKGILAEIIFYNEENGYLVGVLESDTEDQVIVGNMHSPRKGNTLSLTGKWTNHPSYGEQFCFESYSEEMPKTEEGIVHFLASGLIKGIGNKTAISIVSAFGTDTIDIMTHEPERLTEVDGIGSVKAKTIADAFASHKDIMDISIFLQEYGISPGFAVKVYREYKEMAINIIKENPYQLANDIYGISFFKADHIAEKMGIAKDSPYRIFSGIKYMLGQIVGQGHTFAPMEQFAEKTAEALDVRRDDIIETIKHLAIEDELYLETIENRPVVFPSAYYHAEVNVCKNIIKLINSDLKAIPNDIHELIERFERAENISLADNQKKAVVEAVEHGVYVLTGGPGTGKTTTINTIIHILEECGLETALAAPTGRAAKRITETTNREAKTIHRLLEYSYSEDEESMKFGKNEHNPLDCDVIIIDEVSMVDILLMNGLLKAIKPKTRLILVGDADQLPSVGAGNVLRDIIDSEVVPSVKLKEIFRQAGESLIVVNAHRINKGEAPCYNEKDKDFFLIKKNNEQNILQTIKGLCSERLPNFYKDILPMKDIQIISPSRKGLLGTISLNKELQDLLNPASENKFEKKLKDKTFREGDKVMQIKNNYDITWKREDDLVDGEGIYNGDVGFIQSIDNEYNEMIVIFDDNKVVTYDFTQIEELDLAYAVTVHKSQGSEFPILVMPIAWFPPMLTTRNLLYTAVTRAKLAVVLVGSERFLNGMVENNRIIERYSGLKYRLKKYIDEGILE